MLRTSLLDPYHALHMTDLYLSGKTQLKFSIIFQDLAQEWLPGTRQGFTFLDEKTYIPKHHIHHYSMHNALHHTNFIYVENIIAWSISCIAYDWLLSFRKDPVKFSSYISRPRPVRLNRPKIFPMLIQSKAFSGSVRSTLRSPWCLSSWRHFKT